MEMLSFEQKVDQLVSLKVSDWYTYNYEPRSTDTLSLCDLSACQNDKKDNKYVKKDKKTHVHFIYVSLNVHYYILTKN